MCGVCVPLQILCIYDMDMYITKSLFLSLYIYHHVYMYMSPQPVLPQVASRACEWEKVVKRPDLEGFIGLCRLQANGYSMGTNSCFAGRFNTCGP